MTVMKLVVTLLALLGLAGNAIAASWEGVFEGSIGKAKVIAQLNAGVEATSYQGITRDSHYSYLPKIHDLNLVLAPDGDGSHLRFTETLVPHYQFEDLDAGDPRITGAWLVSVDANGATGTWTSPDGKKVLPINLKRVPLVRAESIGDTNILVATYLSRWAETLSFQSSGAEQRFGEVGIRFEKDSAFGIAFPAIQTFPDAARVSAINAMLRTEHVQSVMAYRDCINGVSHDMRGDSDAVTELFEIVVKYASPTLLSMEESGSVFCGGAHPNNYVKPITYDLVALRRIGGAYGLDLSASGFGHILKLASKEERIAFERFALAAWMANAAKFGEDGNGCSDGFMVDAAEGEREFSLSLRPEGLAVTRTDYPHVSSVCLFQDFNPTVLPWADVKPFVRADQTLLPEVR